MVSHEEDGRGRRLAVRIVDSIAGKQARSKIPRHRGQVKRHEEKCFVGIAAQHRLRSSPVQATGPFEGDVVAEDLFKVAQGENAVSRPDTRRSDEKPVSLRWRPGEAERKEAAFQ